MNKIHVVSFDVPYPTNYGGVIDVYHRCKALSDLGYTVILHCFDYGRGKPKELYNVASKVHYYKRKSNLTSILALAPMIVYSRKNKNLLANLGKDQAPIIFEGQHTTAYISSKKLRDRKKLIRSHNVEHDYYKELAKVEKNTIKKWFFKLEAFKLKIHEKVLKQALCNLTVSYKDNDYYKNLHGNAYFLPVANPLSWNNTKRKTKNYVLMHGNLAVKENEHAIRWVIDNIWLKDKFELIIAGRTPNIGFEKYLNDQKDIKLLKSPTNEELNTLIRNAKLNLLITFQNTGIKHKLINALSNGGHVLANKDMVEGTGLEKYCVIANTAETIKEKIHTLLQTENPTTLMQARQKYLQDKYSLKSHAQQIDTILKQAEKN